MGLTFVNAEIYHTESKKNKKKLRFLVDTGAFFSVVPKEILQQLNIKPYKKNIKFKLANGKYIYRDVGVCMFKIDKYVGASDVIFGKKTDQTLLGVITLESLGLAVDPRTKSLKPIELLLVKLEI